MVYRIDEWSPIGRRQALPGPIPADILRACGMCVHSERYRGRLVCLLFRCSTPFARALDGECGPEAKQFRARTG